MLVESLVFQIGITLIVSMLLGAIFAKFKQSPIIGYLLGGILLGPYVLGFIQQTDTEVLSLFSELGVLLLLFFIGIELDVKKFKEGGLIAFVLGPAKIAICFTIGFLLALAFKFTSTEAILLGLIISFTSTVDLGKYLLDNKMMHSKEAKIAIPILLIENFVAVFAIALLSSYGTQGSINTIVLNSIFFMIFAIFVVGWLSRYLIKIMEKLDYKKHITLYSLGIALSLAYASAYFHLSPAIGAFLGGFLLSELKYSKKIKKELETFRDFFVAFFFIGIGLHFVPTNLSIILMGTIILILYSIGQTLAYVLFGALLGLRKKFSVKLSSMMATVGEFSLIIGGLAITLKTPHANDILNIAIFLGVTSILTMNYMIQSSESFSEKLSIIIPNKIERKLRKVRSKAQKLIQEPLQSKKIQNHLLEHFKKIFLNIFIILSIAYTMFYISIETKLSLIEQMPDYIILFIIGTILIIRPLIMLTREIRGLIFTIVKESSKEVFSKYSFNELIKIENSISEIFVSFFIILFSGLLTLIALHISWLFEIPSLITAVLGISLAINGYYKIKKQRIKTKIRIKKEKRGKK